VGILPNQMAIITPYQAQVTLLTSLLRPKYGQSLEIGTVDGMQGREKEAVIISLVRSNGDVRVFPSLHSACRFDPLFSARERLAFSKKRED
jgi:superfamily I DNA and/or RNA helicase